MLTTLFQDQSTAFRGIVDFAMTRNMENCRTHFQDVEEVFFAGKLGLELYRLLRLADSLLDAADF